MGYVGEGSDGGGGGEPMRRPSQVVKMGGKPKKGARGVGGAGAGVDGRGKGDDNWIGGQKTRRQVKVSLSVAFLVSSPLFS